jgi:carbamoyltransferase
VTLTIGLHGVPDPSGRMRIHDHGMAVLRDGRVVWASELERRSRVKHDGAMPDHVEAWLKPWLHDREEVRLALVNGFLGARLESSGRRLRIDGAAKLSVADALVECDVTQSLVPGAPIRAFTVAHEVAHLGTCLAMFGQFRPNSLLVHVDGGASESNASAWHYDGSSLRCIDHAWHPTLKGAVNNFNANPLSRAILGMRDSEHLAMPGKLMGLAAYAEPESGVLASLLEHDFHRAASDSTVRLALDGTMHGRSLGSLSPRDEVSQVIAACMQHHLEEELLTYLGRHVAATGARHVYFSGGAALNVHANRRLERALPIDGLYVPPAPSDAGLALGAAAFLTWRLDGRAHAHGPFLNTRSLGGAGVSLASNAGVSRLSGVHDVALAIAAGAVVGVFGGDAELGPRALGHRSLLCRADSIPLRRRVSETMKKREWYRPVAPLMTAVTAEKWLEPGAPASALADWMLGAYRVTPEAGTGLAGAVHVDGSVRAQIVRPGAPGLAHIEELLHVLERDHGIRAVINTSFNRSGEPLVHEASEAVEAGRELGLDGIWEV